MEMWSTNDVYFFIAFMLIFGPIWYSRCQNEAWDTYVLCACWFRHHQILATTFRVTNSVSCGRTSNCNIFLTLERKKHSKANQKCELVHTHTPTKLYLTDLNRIIVKFIKTPLKAQHDKTKQNKTKRSRRDLLLVRVFEIQSAVQDFHHDEMMWL